MSHGGGGGTEVKAEPNLTPLLDLVLQLVMFFLLVANFSTTQANKTIKLPSAQMAKPVQKEPDARYLNINDRGEVLVLGRRAPLETMDQILFYLSEEARLTKKKMEEEGDASGEMKTIIVIRADKAVEYQRVYDVMQAAKTAKFRKMQLNAMTQNAKR